MSFDKSVKWTEEVYGDKPHCFPGVDRDNNNQPVRWTDFQDHCLKDHRDNPKVVGTTEFLRWIWEVRKVIELTDLADPFHRYDDDSNEMLDTTHLSLSPYHTFMVGTDLYTYAEEYWLRPTNNHSFKMIFCVYMNSDERKARLACFDERYVDVAAKAYANVQQQFIEDAKIGVK